MLDPSGVTVAFVYPGLRTTYANQADMTVQRDTFAGVKVWKHGYTSESFSQIASDGTGVYVSWCQYAGPVHLFEMDVRKLSLAGAALWKVRFGVDHQHDTAYSLLAGPKSLFVGAGSGGFTRAPLVAAIKKTGP